MPSTEPLHIEAASTLAVIVSSNEPLLFLKADLEIIAAIASFCRAFQVDPNSIPGRKFPELGGGEWDMPKLSAMLKAVASGSVRIESYEIDLVRQGKETRNLLVNAQRLDDGLNTAVRLLAAVTDVTLARAEARQKVELIREKAILLQEVQHRVANSLQIIASLLLQSARKVQSEEARGHLHDAHHRIMSIAAVQRHLAVANVKDVPLRPYFAQLCESLGASMIRDPKQLSIEVVVDDSVVTANISVSLGLIITELVINAVKHAFPERRPGKIMIDYRSNGLDWTLTVRDDGVGMATGPDRAKPGLGSGIAEALAKQIQSVFRVVDAQPGTVVTFVHQAAAYRGGSFPAAA